MDIRYHGYKIPWIQDTMDTRYHEYKVPWYRSIRYYGYKITMDTRYIMDTRYHYKTKYKKQDTGYNIDRTILRIYWIQKRQDAKNRNTGFKTCILNVSPIYLHYVNNV